MVDRVLLHSAGLKVSKPGVDVKTASEAGLIFNSEWSAMSRLIFGSFSVNPNSANTRTILYGKSFTYRPLVFTVVHPYAASGDLFGPARQHIGTAGFFAFYSPSPANRYIVDVRNDRFVFQNNSSMTEGDWTSNAIIRYAVWDHGLG
ncbi:hypothetical protein [uncultured Nitratireductor sp.]|uniref:hypothetical protein n=1 Tax=uncultured Nitratireductor sp. TaxID=520953 RepID=UPI0025FD4971|nr:hypothetical protein [uncultured Nitratireductor sp.]